MKKFLSLSLAFAALFLIAGTSGVSAQKFGYINTAELIEAMPEIQEVDTKLEALQKEFVEMLESIQVEFNNKFEDYNKNLSSLSESMKEMKEKELSDLQQRFQEYNENARQQLNQQQQELMAPVIQKAREAIEAVSKNNGFTAIFDLTSGALTYHDPAQMTDILPLVKTHLGI